MKTGINKRSSFLQLCSGKNTLLLLHLLFMLYSLSGVCSKLASEQEFFSFGFCLWYGGVFVLLGIYAVGWQQIIKRLPLTTAFANKAITTIWGTVWGMLIFHESLSPLKILGIALIVAGVVLFSIEGGEV